jgi:hypothetical protein
MSRAVCLVLIADHAFDVEWYAARDVSTLAMLLWVVAPTSRNMSWRSLPMWCCRPRSCTVGSPKARTSYSRKLKAGGAVCLLVSFECCRLGRANASWARGEPCCW